MTKNEMAKCAFSNGYNCAQSVLKPFAGQLDIDVNTALKLSTGFGAGMGRLQGTCGAVTGAYMVLGLKFGQQIPDDTSKEKVIDMIREFTERFKDEHKVTDCRDLLRTDLTTTSGRQFFDDNNLHEKVCNKCVATSVSLLEEMMKG
jgi:C_GCAxxG_C_C family probable redox protein